MATALQKIFNLITYYSTEYPEFESKPKYSYKVKTLANQLTGKNFKIVRKRVIYKGELNKYILNLNDEQCHNNCSCSCNYFIKSSVCKNLVAYSNLNNLNIFDKIYSKPVKFVNKKKKGRKSGRRKLAEKALIRDD